MSNISKPADQAGAQAPVTAPASKRYRVSFSDLRYFHLYIDASDEDAAIEAAEKRIEDGDEGIPNHMAGSYGEFAAIEEVPS